jgi:hypothetical protein
MCVRGEKTRFGPGNQEKKTHFNSDTYLPRPPRHVQVPVGVGGVQHRVLRHHLIMCIIYRRCC